MKITYAITIEGTPDMRPIGAGDRTHEQRYLREPAEAFSQQVERFYQVFLKDRKITVSEGRFVEG